MKIQISIPKFLLRSVSILFSVISLLCHCFIYSTMAQQFQVWNPPPAQTPRYIQREIVVKFKSGVASDAIERFNQNQKVSVLETNNTLGFMRLKTPAGKNVEEMVSIYGNNPDVEYAEPNFIVTAYMLPNDPLYSYQWHLYNSTFGGINLEDAWDISTGSSSVIVAVIDTGVAYENYDIYLQAPDLAGTTFVSGYDFINGDNHPNDDNSHGTHVTGTIAQTTNNKYGVAGIAFQTAIMPVKVLDEDGNGSDTTVANGIQYAVDHGAKVINLSLGGPTPSSVLEDAVKYAYNNGVTIIAATGNDGEEMVGYPAAYEECIAVGATRYDEEIAYYSNYGPEIDLVAPGGDVTVDQNGDGYGDGVLQETFDPDTQNPKDFNFYFFQGTSMATPHVSGVAALVIAQFGDIGPDNVRQKLQNAAEDHGSAGWDKYYGWGIVDAYNALMLVSPPFIADISPEIGPISGGSEVTITGNHFQDGASVTIGGNPATEVTVDSTTQITARIPPGELGITDVVVINPDGQSSSLSRGFAYIPMYGDVSGDGTVSAYDAALILKFVVGLISELPVQQIGAPNQNVTPRHYTVSIPEQSAKAGSRIKIPIAIDDTTDLFAGGITIKYDASVLKAVDALPTKILNGSYWKANILLPSEIRFAFATTEPAKGDGFPPLAKGSGGDLLMVEFEVLTHTEGRTSPLILDNINLSNSLAITKINGSVIVIPSTFSLLQNYPNPFNPDTWIPYQLAAPANVVINIYNVSGQLVRTIDIGYRQAGFYIDKMNAAHWDGCNESGESVTSGVYFYQLQAEKFVSVRKMTIIK